MTTPLLSRIDPDGKHHRDLGYRAADFVFGQCPDGNPPATLIDHIEVVASRAIREKLDPLDATDDDLKAAFRLAAEAFGERYLTLVAAFHGEGGAA